MLSGLSWKSKPWELKCTANVDEKGIPIIYNRTKNGA